MEDLPTVRTSLDGGDGTPPGTPRSKETPATPTTPSIGTRETRSAVEFHRAFHRGSAEGSARVPESSAAATRGAAPRSRFARLRGALHVTEAHRTRPREHPEPRLTAPLVVTWLPGCALAVIRLVVHLISSVVVARARRRGEELRLAVAEAVPAAGQVGRRVAGGPGGPPPAGRLGQRHAVLRASRAEAEGSRRAGACRGRRLCGGRGGRARRGAPRGAPRVPRDAELRELRDRPVPGEHRRRVRPVPERVHVHGRDCVRAARARRRRRIEKPDQSVGGFV